jgi:hypothetical protein
LEGNIFSCDAVRNSLPPKDPKYHTYNCGSDATNNSIIAFTVIAMLCGASLKFVSRSNQTYGEINDEDHKDMVDDNGTYDQALNSLKLMERTTLIGAGYIMGFGMILYGVMSNYFKTYTHT